MLVVVMSDTGGYVLGVLFGKHPMAPKISPKKSWEGFAGSMLFGIVAGVLMAIFALKVPFWVGLLLGVCLVGIGVMGDLIESLIKRDMGIKDMSSVPARSRWGDGSAGLVAGGRPGSLADHVPIGAGRMSEPLPLILESPRRGQPPRHWADLTPAQRREFVEAAGHRAFRARQLSSHYFEGLRTDPGEWTDLPETRPDLAGGGVHAAAAA